MTIKVLWADNEHIEMWDFPSLEKYDIRITGLPSIRLGDILKKMPGKHILVIHCGTYCTISDLKELILSVKKSFPNIKVGLQSNGKYPLDIGIIDFYVTTPARSEKLKNILEKALQ